MQMPSSSPLLSQAAESALYVEQVDDVACRARELMERWDKRLALGKRGFVENYLKGEMRLVIRPSDGARNWGAVFQVAPKSIKELWRRPMTPAVHGDAWRPPNYAQKAPMLSHNVKLVQREETVIPSLVWFEIFDSVRVDLAKPLYHFTSRVLPDVERFPVSADGEPDIFWCDVAVSLGQNIDEDIETASDAVNNDSSLDGNFARDGVSPICLDNLLPRLTIWLSDEAIWATSSIIRNPSPQNLELGYGPIESGLSV